MTTGAEIVSAARKYLGVRWRHQGRSSLGVDCLGLLVLVGKDLGLESRDTTDYARLPDGARLMRELDEQLTRVAEHQAGDILLMRFNSSPQHLAIKTDIGIIHAYAQARKVVEHSLDSVWSSRIVCSYRLPEV